MAKIYPRHRTGPLSIGRHSVEEQIFLKAYFAECPHGLGLAAF
jgi:hypothetical protein